MLLSKGKEVTKVPYFFSRERERERERERSKGRRKGPGNLFIVTF